MAEDQPSNPGAGSLSAEGSASASATLPVLAGNRAGRVCYRGDRDDRGCRCTGLWFYRNHLPAATAPTRAGGDSAAAHQQLCDIYLRAAQAVQIESNGGGTAFARIAAVNSAVMLESAAAAPELKPDERSVALSLARVYRDLTAVGSVVNGSSDLLGRQRLVTATPRAA